MSTKLNRTVSLILAMITVYPCSRDAAVFNPQNDIQELSHVNTLYSDSHGNNTLKEHV